MKFDKAVPDTSIIIEGVISRLLEKKSLKLKTLIIPEAVLAELESQANKRRESGTVGIEEIKKLRELSKKHGYSIQYKGQRPGDFEIKFAKSGEIDSLIRDLAEKENATLLTADIVQSKVAAAKGIDVYLYEIPAIDEEDLLIEKYLSKNTMSLHIREGQIPVAKKGSPKQWKYEKVGKRSISMEAINDFITDSYEKAKMRRDGFVELERKGTTILQVRNMRIIISKPPFSDKHEITVVKSIQEIDLKDYKLSKKLWLRLEKGSEGILVAGSPGQGKSTFVQAIAIHYNKKGMNIKTIENPRDMVLPDTISRLNSALVSNQELFDLLLLTRPDFTFFDEIRNNEDFKLYSDLRLAGIGMLGVIHAHKPIDAIHRFMSRLELGLIPQIVDTIIFVDRGEVSQTYFLDIKVKVPVGMKDSDLARPVISIFDFETGKLLFEIYSFGDQTIAMPVENIEKTSPMQRLAANALEKELSEYDESIQVILEDERKATLRVSKNAVARIIGKDAETITALEKKYGLRFNVEERKKNVQGVKKELLNYSLDLSKDSIMFVLDEKHKEKYVDLYLNDKFLTTVKSSKKNIIKIKKESNIGLVVLNAFENGGSLKIKA